MTANIKPAKPSAGNELVSTRVFDVIRERVFDAFSDPTQLALWWGPDGFTNTIHEFDLKPGGKWRLAMRGPDGAVYENESKFTEVARPERVVFQHLEPVHQFQMAMTFAEESGKTRLTWCMTFESTNEFARVKNFIAEANEQNFDRLAAHLADNNSASSQKITVAREFNAPCALVFSAWTDARHLSSWFSPEGVECRSFDTDIRVGGRYRLHMVSKNGDHIAFGEYKEIIPNRRLRFTWNRKDTPALSTLVTVEFEDLGQTTRLTLTHEGFTEQEDAADHKEGWTSLLEKFARLTKQNKIPINK